MTYSDELSFAMNLAREASTIFKKYFGMAGGPWKEDNTPLTQGDVEINDFMIQRIADAYPDDEVYGEEASNTKKSDRVWVIDPIDGTQPYENGIPVSTIVIALVESGKVALAVIYEPMLNSMYYAERGKGAFKDGASIHCNTRDVVAQSYFATSSHLPEGFASAGAIHEKIQADKGKGFNLRSFTYCAAKVAEGNLCGSVLGVGRVFDIAAPALVVEEAGGQVTDLNGNQLDYIQGSNGIIVTNGPLHDMLLRYVKADS